MATKPIPPDAVERIVADWRTGEYSQRQLANKHSVSNGGIAKLTKGVPHDVSSIVSAGVQYRQGLAAHGEQSAHVAKAIESVVDEKTKDLIFIRKASLIVAQKAVYKVQNEDCSMQDLRNAQEVIGKGKENIYGKSPDTAIQINNAMPPALKVIFTDEA
jgi:hypothetical protein